MKSVRIRVLFFAATLFCFVTAAQAQFGIPKVLTDSVNKGKQITDKFKDIELSDEEEAKLGEQISAKVREKFGVVQDPNIHKYVTLVGTTLARNSSRPKLAWHFIVLDTDGVNAFAAPGGYVHVTRGALAMMKSESELAGVLGHELTHVTEKHTMKAIQKGKIVQMGVNQAKVSDDPALFQKLVDESTKVVMAGYGRNEELEADANAVVLTTKIGYDPSGLRKFLDALNDRNKDSQAKQGLFASHPEMTERFQKLDAAVAKQKSDAMAVLAERFKEHVKYEPVDPSKIAAVTDGAKGLTDGNDGKKDDKKDDKKDEKKPSRFSLSGIKNTASGGSDTKQSASVTGSGGSRGVDREMDSKGGSNPALVAVTVTDAEVADFIKQGNLRA
jgi:beta-barrel assembly-enhancing protease